MTSEVRSATRIPTAGRGRIWLRRGAALGAATAALLAVSLSFDLVTLARAVRGQFWGLNVPHFAEFERKLSARPRTNWYVGVGPGKLQPELPAPTLQPAGGHFSQPVEVTLTVNDSAAAVRCTTDGSIPTNQDARYAGQLQLQSTTVLRCRAFRVGFQASPTSTATFLVNARGVLPALALTVDPTSLSNPYTGIYSQFNEHGNEWERDAHVEFLPRSAPRLEISGRVRIHGGTSRANQKKSFRFYYAPNASTDDRSASLLERSSTAVDHVVILSATESDVARDELFQTMYAQAGGLAPEKMPVFLYLNGDPWGIYYVKERVDEEYLQRRFGPGDYDLLDADANTNAPRVLAGDRQNWNRTVQFFEANDFSDPAVFTAAAELVDIDNFTDYWIYNIYAANVDWPHNNMRFFRKRSGEDGRWRWICWDADATFDYRGDGLNHDTLAWSSRVGLRHDLRYNHLRGGRDTERMVAYTLIARKLLQNPAYRVRFRERMLELLATSLQPDRVMQVLESQDAELAADRNVDWDRWSPAGGDAGRESHSVDLERVRNFIRTRPDFIRASLASFLDEGRVSAARSLQ